MPRFKQPATLQNITFDALVTHIVTCCDRYSVADNLNRLIESIAVIRKQLSDYLPGILFVKVCRQFLREFYRIGEERSYEEPETASQFTEVVGVLNLLGGVSRYVGRERPNSHHKAVLEILMDVETAELTCGGEILRYLDHREAHRILGLKILDLSAFYNTRFKHIGKLRLRDLTTFICPGLCTDGDLEILGSRCPKLQVLMIQESKSVTDRGLRALRPCSELRVINLHYCSTSDSGVNEMLSANKKLEEFNVGRYYTFGEKSFEILSREKSSVCPSIRRFSIKSNPITDGHLDAVVTLFPNLNHLRICCKLEGDIRVLKNLRKLTELNLSYGYTDVSMVRLKELLADIGANISVLNLHGCYPNICITQDDLNFIFKYCGNVESLTFDYQPTAKVDKLVIPPFRKLSNLTCYALTQFNGSRVILNFDKMLELENLLVQGFDGIFQMTESMMLDHVKFPNLKNVRTFYNDVNGPRRIMQIAENNNLDFSFQFSQ